MAETGRPMAHGTPDGQSLPHLGEAVTSCPVCPCETVRPVDRFCPNCSADLLVLRRLETLPATLLGDGRNLLEAGEPSRADIALKAALLLDPHVVGAHDLMRRLEAEARVAEVESKQTPTATTDFAPTPAPVRSSRLSGLVTAFVAVIAFCLGYGASHPVDLDVRSSQPPVSVSPSSAAVSVVPSVTPTSEPLEAYKENHHHEDAEFVVLSRRLRALQTGWLTSDRRDELKKRLVSAGDFHLYEAGDVVTIVAAEPMFGMGETTLSNEGKRRLRRLLPHLAGLRVELEGHVDSQPSPANAEIALLRAAAVASFVRASTESTAISSIQSDLTRPVPGTDGADPANRTVLIRVRATREASRDS